MLKFNTLFPVKSDASIDGLISIANTWILGSPHSRLNEEVIEQNNELHEWEHKVDNEVLSCIHGATENITSFGLRYSKSENELRWVTDIIGAKNGDKFLVSIQVSCDATNPGAYIPDPKKPYIVKQLLEKIGGGADSDLVVQDSPYYLKDSEIDFAANLIDGPSNLDLPIVYVSSGGKNERFVDPEKLARWFSGMAHVVVEPNRGFSFRLMQEVSHRNAYGGAVGIYWPHSAGREILLPSTYAFDSFHLERDTSNLLRNGLNKLRPPRVCTWGYLKELSARRRIEELRGKGSTEIDDYIQAFDKELEAKTDELEAANKEIYRLNAQLQAANRANTSVAGDPVLVKGAESELYENEYKELLLSILTKTSAQIHANSRRQHILEDVLSSNTVADSIESKCAEIKAQLKGYRTMTSETRRFLEELGFEITGDGKHYKAVFMGDNRYTVSIPKTSSDHRAGMNLASEIINLLF